MDGFIGELRAFGGNFAPRAWAFCNGQLLSIAQNQALFSILGTTYGGDGRTTFALPDLRGRVPISQGTGPGLSTVKLGQRSGIEYVNLNTLQIPSHDHTASFTQTGGIAQFPATTDTATKEEPENGDVLATTDVGGNGYIYSNATADTTLASGSVTTAANVQVFNQGASSAHNNMQPSLTIHWIICMFGTFPSRS